MSPLYRAQESLITSEPLSVMRIYQDVACARHESERSMRDDSCLAVCVKSHIEAHKVFLLTAFLFVSFRVWSPPSSFFVRLILFFFKLKLGVLDNT